jgi:hypothetical protein
MYSPSSIDIAATVTFDTSLGSVIMLVEFFKERKVKMSQRIEAQRKDTKLTM